MIKFVCASCGERLSVPEQHGGRKGVCPTCGAVNRIPLKGYAETQPRAPVVARLAGNVTEPPAPAAASIVRGALSIPALTGRANDPEPPTEEAEETEETEVEESAQNTVQGRAQSEDFAASVDDDESDESDDSPTETPAPPPTSASAGKPAPAASLGIFGSAPPTDAITDRRSATPSRPTFTQEADERASDHIEEASPVRQERQMPRPVKIFLLVFFVVAIVGGLYCALYFGIPALMRILSNG